jgi:hypothetical protein
MSDAVYLGNPNLKKANTPISFTKDQVGEFIKCKDDPVYFAKNYVKIISLDEGLVPFEMYDFQEKLIENFHNHRFNIAKLPRQTGKSTTVISYLLHYAVFNDNIKIAILANKAETSRELLSRLQLAYENLPKWMQQGIVAWNLWNWIMVPRLSLLLPHHLLYEETLLTSSSLTSLRSFPTTWRNSSSRLYILPSRLVRPQRLLSFLPHRV